MTLTTFDNDPGDESAQTQFEAARARVADNAYIEAVVREADLIADAEFIADAGRLRAAFDAFESAGDALRYVKNDHENGGPYDAGDVRAREDSYMVTRTALRNECRSITYKEDEQ